MRAPIVWKWNYKSAVTSSCGRGALFFTVNLRSGLAPAAAALVTEFCLRFATSGFYGAITQSLRYVEPPRTATAAALIILPVAAHALEFIVHAWRGTANIGLSIAVSSCRGPSRTATSAPVVCRHGAARRTSGA